jgi:hypothetical protein
MLMARMLNEKDFKDAISLGVTEESWGDESMRHIWRAMEENHHARRPHDIPAIFDTMEPSEFAVLAFTDVVSDTNRYTTLNLSWQIERTFGL